MKHLERQLDDPVRRKALWRWFAAGLVVLAIAEVAVPLVVESEPAHFWFEDIPAWGSIAGLLACVAIILVSKLLGKLGLARAEHDYDS